MNTFKINQFTEEVLTIYRGELYLARNNGAVCRQQRANKRKRPLDETWTFGSIDKSTGYRKTSSTPVHRIIATAFHGEQPTPGHVVDHIDTNRLNNEPDNLRWVTRLDNILKNPKTLRRIENKWGSLEGLLKDPNPMDKADPITNRPWMWQALLEDTIEEETTIDSLTPSARQRNWKTPSEFPMCPQDASSTHLQDYLYRLEGGVVFSRNQYGESIVDAAGIDKDTACLSVVCKMDNGVKDYAVAKITLEDGKYIHTNLSTYFTHEGAEKAHFALMGMQWKEPEGYQGCIDDYC